MEYGRLFRFKNAGEFQTLGVVFKPSPRIDLVRVVGGEGACGAIWHSGDGVG